MKTFETEYQLQEFRNVESQHFNSDGKAYSKVSEMTAEQMLRLINQLESEIDLSFHEKYVIEKMNNMCVESLPPQHFDNWEKIKEQLLLNRIYPNNSQPETPQWEPWKAELKKLGFVKKEIVVESPYPEGRNRVKITYERPFVNSVFVYNLDEEDYKWYHRTDIGGVCNWLLLNIREKDDLLRLFHYLNVMPE